MKTLKQLNALDRAQKQMSENITNKYDSSVQGDMDAIYAGMCFSHMRQHDLRCCDLADSEKI